MVEINEVTVTTRVSRTQYLSSDKETRKLEFVISNGREEIKLTEEDVEKLLKIFFNQGIFLAQDQLHTMERLAPRSEHLEREGPYPDVKLKQLPRNLPAKFKEIGRDFSHSTDKSRPKSEYVLLMDEIQGGFGYYTILNGISSKYESVGIIEDNRTPIGKFLTLLKRESSSFSIYRVAKNVKYSWKRIKAMIKILELEGYIKAEDKLAKGTLYSLTQKGIETAQVRT